MAILFLKRQKQMREIRAIGVYCSSYDTVNSIYKKAAVTLGKELAKAHPVTKDHSHLWRWK